MPKKYEFFINLSLFYPNFGMTECPTIEYCLS